MTEGLFISYRRSDSQSATGRLADHLRQNGFGGEGDVFLDIDERIPPGVDFRTVINETLADCDLVIVVIGLYWLDASDSKGRRRLDRTSDTHRLEVAAALNSAARVIPVLVEGATHPSGDDLPEDLKELAYLQSWSLGERNYSEDVENLAHGMLDARRQMEAERAAADNKQRADPAGESRERQRRFMIEARRARLEKGRQDRERTEAAAEQEGEQLAADAAASAAENERQASERAEAAAAENQRARPATEAVSEEKEFGTKESGSTSPGPVESPTGTLLTTLSQGGSMGSAVFSADGTQIVTASDDGTAGVWDLDGTRLTTLNHDGPVYSAVFSPDGNRILTASADGIARVWEPDGTHVTTLNHDGPVYSAAFSADGNRIVTASDDGTAGVWDLDGTRLTTLNHDGPVYSAAFSPDGTRIVTASQDDTARVWDALATGPWQPTIVSDPGATHM